jgi:hypothetical protein
MPSVVETFPLPDNCAELWQTPERFAVIDSAVAMAKR